jgi:hypothetical protein
VTKDADGLLIWIIQVTKAISRIYTPYTSLKQTLRIPYLHQVLLDNCSQQLLFLYFQDHHIASWQLSHY